MREYFELDPMCRLLAHVSRRPLTVAEAIGEVDLASFGDLAPRHPDGWGMAWWPSLDAAVDGAVPQRRRAVGSARENPEFTATMRGVRGCATVVHLRGATRGLTIGLENCHPFVLPGAAFAQNGRSTPSTASPSSCPSTSRLRSPARRTASACSSTCTTGLRPAGRSSRSSATRSRSSSSASRRPS